MAAEQLLIQYPIALEIIKSWKEQNILYHLDKDEDVYSVLFPHLNALTEDDIHVLRHNTDFLRLVTEAFPIVMLYYGMLYSDTGFQILNEVRFLILFVRGVWIPTQIDEEEEPKENPQLEAPRKEHVRIARMLHLLSALQLTYQYESLKDFAFQQATDYPDEIALETVELWKSSFVP